MKIGFFDSGLGGLTILRAVARKLPQYDYLFYGDTANLPYGNRTEEEIYEFTKTGIEYLFEHDCLLNIIACNTASAETARRLQLEYLPAHYPERKILGIIVPTIETLSFEKSTQVGLIGTTRTIESMKYDKEIELKGNGNVCLTSVATPELVPLIEANEIEAAAQSAITQIERKAGESEVVILGCTHYTELKEKLRTHFSESKKIISQDEVIPDKLKIYLEKHPEIAGQLSNTGERVIHLTKHRPDYDHLMGLFLGGVYVGE